MTNGFRVSFCHWSRSLRVSHMRRGEGHLAGKCRSERRAVVGHSPSPFGEETTAQIISLCARGAVRAGRIRRPRVDTQLAEAPSPLFLNHRF